MSKFLHNVDGDGINKINKIIKLSTKKKFSYYFYEYNKINFHYYDLSNIHIINNFDKIKKIYNQIFECDKIWIESLYWQDDDYTFDKKDFNVFFELDIIKEADITLERITDFYKNNDFLYIYLANIANTNVLQKFEHYLRKFTQDENEILIIKQKIGIEEKIFENKIIIDEIYNIYQNYDFVYICIAPGEKNKIPDIFVQNIINNYRTAIIYISELTDSFPPFWLKNNQDIYVSECNMKEAFSNTSKLLTNKLDVYMFEYRIPYKLDFFFSRLNSVITKKTLFYFGFEGDGSLKSETFNNVLKIIFDNSNIKIYRPYQPIKADDLVHFINDDKYKNKYLKYKQKYIIAQNKYKLNGGDLI
jgi:hypothetical protein